jgi:hypothetical protein
LHCHWHGFKVTRVETPEIPNVKLSAMIGALLLLQGTSALAQQVTPIQPFPAQRVVSPNQHAPAGRHPPERPCANDVKKFCGKLDPGEGRIFHCMDAHKPQLTQACRIHLESVEWLHARTQAVKAKLQAKRIKEGKPPDPLLNPTPIGHNPMEGDSDVTVVGPPHRPRPPKTHAKRTTKSSSGKPSSDQTTSSPGQTKTQPGKATTTSSGDAKPQPGQTSTTPSDQTKPQQNGTAPHN